MNTKFLIFMFNLFFIFIFFSNYSYSGGEVKKNRIYSSLKDVPDNAWKKLSKKTFYFGHQSVGYNIIDGIKDLLKEYPKIKMNIVETRDSTSLSPGTLGHSQIGINSDPQSKFDDFLNIIESGLGKKVDAAALKLCYVDISKETNPSTLFSRYETTIEKIRESYPGITLVHFTSPLTTLQSGPKAWVKKLFGRPVYGSEENIKRYEYNKLLRAKYKGRDPILDIATIESTYPNGTRSTFKAKGNTYFALVADYTYDDGHLNEIGRKKVAEQFILILASLD